jgi:hypothetical protein
MGEGEGSRFHRETYLKVFRGGYMVKLFYRRIRREYVENNKFWRMTLTYGFDENFARKTGQLPYLSIQGELQFREKKDGEKWGATIGCPDKGIGKVFPELAFLVKWKCADINGLPPDYRQNSFYWFRRFDEEFCRETAIEAFKEACIFGAVNGDEACNIFSKDKTELYLSSWLAKRVPHLKTAFWKDVFKAKSVKFLDIEIENI